MAKDLDLKIARTIYMLKVIERAYHSKGVWEIGSGGIRVVAERRFEDDSVAFFADFPCSALDGSLLLFCDGELVYARDFEPPSESGVAQMAWRLSPQTVRT